MTRQPGTPARSGFASGPVAVRAPATSANLGPGFDTFALALGLHDSVEAVATTRGLDVEVGGEGAGEVPRDEGHLVVRALRATLDRLGVPQPGLRLRCRNSVPQGRGLGSSAAAIVTGIRLAQALVPDSALPPGQDLELAAALEGHADNVAACLLGGFTLAWTASVSVPPKDLTSGTTSGTGGQIFAQGEARAVRLDVHPDVRPVVFVPPRSVLTQVARSLLPDEVSHVDARQNAAVAGLLVAALTTYPEHLLAATADRLHQEFRRPAMPETLDLVDRLRADGIPAVVSGAGPSVLALETGEHAIDQTAWTPTGWFALALPVDSVGAVGIRVGAEPLDHVYDGGSW